MTDLEYLLLRVKWITEDQQDHDTMSELVDFIKGLEYKVSDGDISEANVNKFAQLLITS